MPDLESFIPIVLEHNLASNPLGFVEHSNGRVVMKMSKDANVTVEDINTMNRVFAPAYVVTKEKDGVVLECELLAMSLNVNRH